MAVWVDFEHPRPDFEPTEACQRGHKGSYEGPKMVQNGSKMLFPKMDWESIGNILGQIWKHFEAFSTMLEPTNGANYNGNGPCWDQKRVQNGTKMTVLKINSGSNGNILGRIWEHFEAFLTMFEPAKSANYNGNGPCWDQKRVKNGPKMTLLKIDWESIINILGPFWNHFETFLTILEPANAPKYNGTGPF